MIYLLTGPDTYRSREKLHEIIAVFREKAGDFDYHRIDAADDNAETLRGAMQAQSLFQRKKLIVVERPSEAPPAFCRALVEAVKLAAEDAAVTLVLRDEVSTAKVGTALKSAGVLITKAQEFPLMKPAEERRWLLGWLGKRNLKLSENDVEEVLQRFSGNTWQLAHEAEKMALGGLPASPLARMEEKTFAFTDAVLLDAAAAARALARLRHSGIADQVVFAALAGHLRTLLLVADGAEDKTLHPYAVKKAREKLRRVPAPRIEQFYQKVFEADVKVKTGVLTPFEALTDLVLLG